MGNLLSKPSSQNVQGQLMIVSNPEFAGKVIQYGFQPTVKGMAMKAERTGIKEKATIVGPQGLKSYGSRPQGSASVEQVPMYEVKPESVRMTDEQTKVRMERPTPEPGYYFQQRVQRQGDQWYYEEQGGARETQNIPEQPAGFSYGLEAAPGYRLAEVPTKTKVETRDAAGNLIDVFFEPSKSIVAEPSFLTTQEYGSLSESMLSPMLERAGRARDVNPLVTYARENIAFGIAGAFQPFEAVTKPAFWKGVSSDPHLLETTATGLGIVGMETIKQLEENPLGFGIQMATGAAIFGGIGKGIGKFTQPKVSTSIEIGEIAYGGKVGIVESGIVTKVGRKQYGTSAMTRFTIPGIETGISRGVSLLKTTEGVRTPEYRFGASVSKSLGEFKGSEISIGAGKTIKVTPGLKPIGEPSAAIGAFKSRQFGNLQIAMGVSKGKTMDFSLSLLRKSEPATPSISGRQFFKAPKLETPSQHVQTIAKSIEKELGAQPKIKKGVIPSYRTGQFTQVSQLPGQEMQEEYIYLAYPSEKRASLVAELKTGLATEMRMGKIAVLKQERLSGQRNIQLPLNIMATGQGTGQSQASLQKQMQKQTTRQTQKQALRQITMPRLSFRAGFKPMSFALPHFDMGFGKGKSSFLPSRRRYRYTPDVGSILLGIRARIPKAVLSGRQMVTGIGWRPIPKRRRK